MYGTTVSRRPLKLLCVLIIIQKHDTFLAGRGAQERRDIATVMRVLMLQLLLMYACAAD